MISKKLLSEVLDENITNLKVNEKDNDWLKYTIAEGGISMYGVNIHELAHKCKEWAFDKHNKPISTYKKKHTKYRDSDESKGKKVGDVYWVASIFPNYTYADTEPEAIFKACEWILKENKCKQC